MVIRIVWSLVVLALVLGLEVLQAPPASVGAWSMA